MNYQIEQSMDLMQKLTILADAANNYYYSENNAIIAKQKIPYDSIYDFANYGEASQPYELIYGCKTTVIPESVKIIGFMAFTGLKTLTKITIRNDSIFTTYNKFICVMSFHFFTATNLLFSYYCIYTITTIKIFIIFINCYFFKRAFFKCGKLAEITIPEGVEKGKY